MHNVVPSRALARRSRQLLTLALVIASIGAFIAAIGFVLFVIPLVPEGSQIFGLYSFARGALIALGVLLFGAAVVLAVRAATWKTDNDLAQQLAATLGAQLDARFTLIRNVSRRELGYLDAVLVGPPGALVFRLLDDKGIFANEGADWLVQNRRGDWSPWKMSPTRQVVADIQKMRDFLAGFNLGDVPVYGVIVFMREAPEVQLMGKQPTVPLTPQSTLLANLRENYLAKDRIDAPRIAATVRTLYQV
jgi:hypothetical protein